MSVLVDFTAQDQPSTSIYQINCISEIVFIIAANLFTQTLPKLTSFITLLEQRPLVAIKLVVKGINDYQGEKYSAVAVGGTFDHLHLGHQILLLQSVLLAEDILYVGLTSEALLTKKTNKPLLQSYNLRQHILKEYVRSLKPTLRIEVSQLHQPCGVAVLISEIQALVVSAESINGATLINKVREQKGFIPLKIHFCAMMSPDGNVSTKLSSTASRNYVLVKSQLTVEEYMRYREYWEKVVLGLCCEAQQTTNRLTVQKWWEILLGRYSQYWRYYHTNRHIFDLLQNNANIVRHGMIKHHASTANCNNELVDELALILAIFFHDVVYNQQSGHNEEDSALLCQQFLKDLLADNLFRQRIIVQTTLLILQTKTHRPSHPLSQRLYDLDMGILDTDLENYKLYAENIRKQYLPSLGIQYPAKRLAFLNQLLSKTPYFSHPTTNYESNIRHQIETLSTTLP